MFSRHQICGDSCFGILIYLLAYCIAYIRDNWKGKFSIEFRICPVQNFFLDFCQNFWSRHMHDKKLDVNLDSFELKKIKIGPVHFLDCPSKIWSNIFAFIFFCVPLFWGFRWIEITCADRNFVYFESCCFCAWGSSTQLDFLLIASKY